MRSIRHGFLCLPLVTSVFATGCFVVKDGPLDQLTIHDAAVPDMGSSVQVAETCGGSSYTITENSTFVLDTTGRANDLSPLCQTSPGPDIFLKVDVSTGQYWHFHLQPSGANAATRDPVLHVFPIQNGVCNTAACTPTTSRNACGAGGEEHFGVQFATTGTYAIAVDELTAMGGQYNLFVFRPTCGNASPTTDIVTAQSQAEHGEGCDDGNTADGDGCDHLCRVEISGGQSETAVNEDRFWANKLVMNSAGDSANFTGMFVGTACDVDTYAVALDAGKQVQVRLFSSPGGVCYTPANLPVGLRVNTATGGNATGGNSITTDGNGCALIQASVGASAGELLITLENPAGTTAPNFNYRLQVDIL